MNSVVFGEQNASFAGPLELAKKWSTGENPDKRKLHEYWRTLERGAFGVASSLGHEQAEKNLDPRKSIHDARVQARYVTGSLMLYLLYLDPDYHGMHPTKPPWHTKMGANSLASIITTEAADIMSRKDNTRDHQRDIDMQNEKKLANL